jgi:hypothetical protein
MTHDKKMRQSTLDVSAEAKVCMQNGVLKAIAYTRCHSNSAGKSTLPLPTSTPKQLDLRGKQRR